MNLTRVLYHLAADYHSGQSSRGYRLACRCLRKLNRRGYWSGAMNAEERRLYDELAARYGDKL